MNWEVIIVGLLSLLGTVVTVVCSNAATKKVIAYQIETLHENIGRLEEKQDKHNGVIERMTRAEESLKIAHKRIDEIRKDKQS